MRAHWLEISVDVSKGVQMADCTDNLGCKKSGCIDLEAGYIVEVVKEMTAIYEVHHKIKLVRGLHGISRSA